MTAPAALEFYGFRFFLYSYYDHDCFEEAEKAFFDGYQEAGGKYIPSTSEDYEAIDFLAGCRLLELAGDRETNSLLLLPDHKIL